MWTGNNQTCDLEIDSGEECLVTDIAHELSVGLENPLFLTESLSLFENNFKEDYTTNSYDIINECMKTEDSDELVENCCIVSTDHSSGSGSETSSLEQCWSVKEELDTPPITPPNSSTDVSLSPETVCLLQGSHLKFVPLSIAELTSQSSRNSWEKSRYKSCRPTLKQIPIQPNVTVTKDVFPLEVFSSNGEVFVAPLSPNEIKRNPLSKEELLRQQAKRRQERMIRNRESAYLSRKRKKEHVTSLEKQVETLTLENNLLRLENAELKERLQKLDPFSVKKSWRRLPNIPRKTTTLLALVVTVCLNVGSFTGVIDSGQDFNEVNLPSSSSSHHTRSLLWTDPLNDSGGLANLTTSCPVAINQSESIRIESELRRWIVGEKEMQQTKLPHSRGPNRTTQPSTKVKKRRKRSTRTELRSSRLIPNTIDFFDMNAKMLDMESLYEAIHRRPDTFYLVSFSADHLLLPALSSNNVTARPKMSVMVPAFLANGTKYGTERVEMMQIDCEVTNTQLLSVRETDIPSHMRVVLKYDNTTVKDSTFHQYSVEKEETPFAKEVQTKGGVSILSRKPEYSNLSLSTNDPLHDAAASSFLPNLILQKKIGWIKPISRQSENSSTDELSVSFNGEGRSLNNRVNNVSLFKFYATPRLTNLTNDKQFANSFIKALNRG